MTKVKPSEKQKLWTCAKCKQSIAADDGYINVKDSQTGGYPRKATSDEVTLTDEAIEKRRERGQPTSPPYGMLNLGEVKWPLTEDNIVFVAFHIRCDPDLDDGAYAIEVGRAPTLEAWCAWIYHLSEKTWMGKQDIAKMIHFWFSNRGDDVHHHSH